jgi:CRISPR/Cas system-associated endoribonuclease Cas2
MDFDKVIFGKKSFSSLLEDIYSNSKNKEKQLSAMIAQLKEFINEPGDAVMIVPLLKEYLEISVKNDDALIKMAGIVQRAMTNNNPNEEGLLSDRDKELLFEERVKYWKDRISNILISPFNNNSWFKVE